LSIIFCISFTKEAIFKIVNISAISAKYPLFFIGEIGFLENMGNIISIQLLFFMDDNNLFSRFL